MTKDSQFEVQIVVRGYELDAFNHVNNAVFVQYFEHARWMAFKEWGMEEFAAEGLSFVVRKLTVEYFRPAHVFDELTLRLWVERVGNTSLTFGQEVFRPKDQAVLAKGEVVAVCLGSTGRPCAVPQSWRAQVSD